MGFIGGVLKCGALSAVVVAVFLGMLTTGKLAELGFFNQVAPTDFIGAFPAALSSAELASAWNYNDMVDMTGTVSIVTGANVGLGYYSALHLAEKGSKVVLGCRSVTKCDAAAAAMQESSDASLDLVTMKLDLGSLQSVEDFATEFKEKFDRLDVALFNAGFARFGDLQLSTDGIETSFAVNHIGHFKLFKDLRELIEKTAETADVKIISVSSSAHFNGIPEIGVYTNLADINNAEKFVGLTWYGQSKMANVLFAQEIAAQMEGKRVFSNAAHPGVVNTAFLDKALDLFEETMHPVAATFINGFITVLKEGLMWTSDDGALTQVFLAASSDVVENDIRGKYFHPIATEVTPSPLVTEELQKALWKFSEELVAERGF